MCSTRSFQSKKQKKKKKQKLGRLKKRNPYVWAYIWLALFEPPSFMSEFTLDAFALVNIWLKTLCLELLYLSGSYFTNTMFPF